jgi:hypothetical protein
MNVKLGRIALFWVAMVASTTAGERYLVAAPPNVLIVCIETQPDYPPGVHMLTGKTIKQLSNKFRDYETQEARRLELETSLAKEYPGLALKPAPRVPDSEVGFLVTFKRDCQK